MSLTTVSLAARDDALGDRIIAAVWTEAISNPEFGDSDYGQLVLDGSATILATFAYPIAVDNQAAYASAIAAGNPNPGGDEAVITDANISTGVQVHWPADQPA